MRRPALLVSLLLLACSHDGPANSAARSQAPSRARREARPEHDVYSLVDNRLYAHWERGGGLVLVPAAPGFAKYQHFGGKGTLGVPLTEEQAAAGTILVRTSGARDRAVSVVANGRAAPPVKAGADAVAVRVAGLHAGENDLAVRVDKGAIESVQIGGVPAGDALPGFDAAQRALVLPAGTALVYYLAVPPGGARLIGDVGGAGCSIAATAHGAEGADVAGTLTGETAALDLAPLAGRVVRLRLASDGCPAARIAALALAVPGSAPLAALRRNPPRNIVLWIMDSLRADRIAAVTPGARPESPTFAALAERGTVFTSAYAQGNESRASYASIWTSLYPANHGLTEPGIAIDGRFVTLGAAMKDAGLRTAGATGNGYITERWGFGAGWDAFTNRIHDEGSTRGDDILEAGLAAVNEPASPFFLYLGTVDTHVSWRGKQPWLGRYDTRPYDGPYQTIALGRDVDRMSSGDLEVSGRDREHIVALYDSNVSYQDDLLGKLVAKLGAWGVGDDTMLVIAADHGDELWENGRVGHGGSLAETLVHVPLVVVYPPLFPPRTVVTEEVELVDVLPTLLDAEGLAAPEAAQGASLIPLAAGVGRGYPRGAVSSQFETAHALRLFGWKARVGTAGGLELYHVAADPFEKEDVARTRPVERRYLTDVLGMYLAHRKEWQKRRWGAVANVTAAMAGDLER